MKSNPKHVEKLEVIADRLLDLILQRIEKGELTDGGIASVQRLLKENGWVIEDDKMDAVRSKLTATINPKDLEIDDDDDGVIARIG